MSEITWTYQQTGRTRYNEQTDEAIVEVVCIPSEGTAHTEWMSSSAACLNERSAS